jgi:hypothetical protein
VKDIPQETHTMQTKEWSEAGYKRDNKMTERSQQSSQEMQTEIPLIDQCPKQINAGML